MNQLQFEELKNLLDANDSKDIDLGIEIAAQQIDELDDWQKHWIWLCGSGYVCTTLKYKYNVWDKVLEGLQRIRNRAHK